MLHFYALKWVIVLQILLNELLNSYKFSDEQKKYVQKLLINYDRIKNTKNSVDIYEELIKIKSDYHDHIVNEKLIKNNIWEKYISILTDIRPQLMSIISKDENLRKQINEKNILFIL